MSVDLAYLLGTASGIWLAAILYRAGWSGRWPWQRRARRYPACANGSSCFAPWGCASPEWKEHQRAVGGTGVEGGA